MGQVRDLIDGSNTAARGAAGVVQARLDASVREMEQNMARIADRHEVRSGRDLRERHGADAAFL